MLFYIMTLFPDMVMDGLNTSIIGRAMDKGLLDIEAVNIRDYAFNKHNSVDDYPYGGGAGMLMQAEPVYQCYEAVKKKIETKALLSNPGTRKNPRVIYLSPTHQMNSNDPTFHIYVQNTFFNCRHKNLSMLL